MLVAPVILTWSYPAAWRMSARQRSGLTVLLAATAVISDQAFFDQSPTFLRTWYVYPAMIWVAVAYQVRGIVLALLIVAAAAIWSAIIGAGGFTEIAASQLENVAFAQQFVAITAVAALMLAAAADERRGLDALHRSEARENSIMETAVDPIIVINERGIIVFCNVAVERTFGHTRKEIVGQNVSLLMPEPHQTSHDGYLDRYHRTGDTRIIGIARQVEGLRKDGTTFPLDLSVAEWHADGTRFFTGIIHDQTERVRAEAALRASERRLAIAPDASGGAVYERTVPPSGDIYISPQLSEMPGYESVPVTFDRFDAWVSEQVHADDREGRRVLRQAFFDGQVPRFEIEVRMRHSAGRWIRVRSYAQALERDGNGRSAGCRGC